MNRLPYIIVLLYPVIGFFIDLSDYKNEKITKFFKPQYVFFLFLIISSFRGNGDGDYFRYLNGVSYIDTFSKIFIIKDYPFEIGFRFIAYINNLLKLTPQFTIFMMSLISLTNIRKVVNKYSTNELLSWLLYFPFLLMFDMHHSRNAVAMSFTLLFFFSLVFEKNIKVSIFNAIAAFTFHKSSLFAILVISMYSLVKSDKFEKFCETKRATLTILTVTLLGLVLSPFSITNFMQGLFPDAKLIRKLYLYFVNDRWSYGFNLYDPRLLLILFIFYCGLILVKNKSKEFKRYSNIMLISILTIVYLSESTLLTIRFYNYFNLVSIFYVPLMFKEMIDFKYKTPLMYFIVSAHVLYFLMLCFKQVPYTLFF